MTGQMCEGSATRHEDGPPSDALSNQGEVMVFQLETGTPHAAGVSAPADQPAQTRDLHRQIDRDREEVKGEMMPMPEFENDIINRSQRQGKLLPELEIPGNNRSGLGREAEAGGRDHGAWAKGHRDDSRIDRHRGQLGRTEEVPRVVGLQQP